MASANGGLPLGDLRVLELGHIVAGPSAGLILADLGADVIKIERPGLGGSARPAACPARRPSTIPNRNKRSSPSTSRRRGKALFLRLVETADVVLDNFARARSTGWAWATPRWPGQPAVIYLSVKGFLPGPYEQRPSLDELAQMMGGLAYMTRPRAGRCAGALIVDIGAACRTA